MKNAYSDVMSAIKKVRDDRRPSMDQVIEVMDRVFRDVVDDHVAVDRGPVTWSWLDTTNSEQGYEKWYVVSTSAMDGTDGYPLLTIRLSTAPRLDAWLTTSQLIVGPDDSGIETSIAMAIAHHQAAFEGFRESVNGVLASLTGGSDANADTIIAEAAGTNVN